MAIKPRMVEQQIGMFIDGVLLPVPYTVTRARVLQSWEARRYLMLTNKPMPLVGDRAIDSVIPELVQ